MVVRMVVRVELDTMGSKVLYPPEEQSAERIALLTGIVQLVSTALKRDGGSTPVDTPNYMKSDKGVVGYIQRLDFLYICEADNEKEAGSVLSIVIDNINATEEYLITIIAKALRKRGREISSLWG
ncbi:hypothetical protein EU528_06630 [Candidatus Thorarchaeota archaeon]|nr:MAG: hypothetical protein EU528_06630 [Candidatus Thorarchaeota archaeon]